LEAEPVEGGAEDVVVIEPREQPVIERRLFRPDAVHDALMQVRRAQTPDATREMEVVRIVHLREVVDRPGQLREREIVRPAVVADLDEALLDVDVRCAVLTHRAELTR
jgi:hypothetical protein